MTLEYRLVNEADREVALQLFLGYMKEPPAPPNLDKDRVEPWFARQFDDALKGGRHYWLAEADGQPLGFVIFMLQSYTHDLTKKYGKIVEFYIVPEQRRGGYGRQLARAAFAAIKRLGVSEIEADVLEQNTDALAFWQAVGMGISHYVLTMDADEVGE